MPLTHEDRKNMLASKSAPGHQWAVTFSPKNGTYDQYIEDFLIVVRRLCGFALPRGGYVYVKEYGADGKHEHAHFYLWLKRKMRKNGIMTAFLKNGGIPRKVMHPGIFGKGIRKVNTPKFWEDYMAKEENSEMETHSEGKPTDEEWAHDIEEYAGEPTKRPELNRRNDIKSWAQGEELKWFLAEEERIRRVDADWPEWMEKRLGLNKAMMESAKANHMKAREKKREDDAERQRRCRRRKRELAQCEINGEAREATLRSAEDADTAFYYDWVLDTG